MSYQLIEHYGVIGDMRTAALVGMDGSIDWCCLPHFDSPSVFAKILDDRKGGFFSLAPAEECQVKQMYLPDTNVLVTRFFSDSGMGEVSDFMSVSREAGGHTDQSARQIVRIAKAIRGPLRFRMECRPAFDYARQKHELEIGQDGKCALFSSAASRFALKSSHALEGHEGAAVAEFSLKGDEQAVFVLRHDECASGRLMEETASGDQLLTETVRFWRDWASHSRYHGRWREMVTRSALVLKLLTFLPTGAIVAAPTTSLPEAIGGVRNWDYRYTWVRDAAFTVYSLMRLGYTEEAGAFAQFMQARAKEEEPNGSGPLNVLYGIDGRHDTPEETLDHLDGYRGSKPVRIGNAAVGHLQLDIYGELMDALYLYDKYGAPLSYDMWITVEHMLDWVVQHWRDDDQSIWEVRGGRRQFTYSKLQCWVALDRGVRLARKRSFPTESDQWRYERNKIYTAIMKDAWNEKKGAFTQYFGSNACDASLLMMPLMLFVSPKDPRMIATIETIQRELASDSLVLRYEVDKAAEDGLPGNEGFFSVCSFWMVEAMARAGRVEEAQLLFEKLISYANHLGLFSEEIGSKGELLGNFPQALTHLGLISAAHNLDLLLDGR